MKLIKSLIITILLLGTGLCYGIDQNSTVTVQVNGKEVKGKYLVKDALTGYIVLPDLTVYFVSTSTPDPGPLPPDPLPGKIFVLAIAETSDLVKLPLPQASIITSLPVREYLTDKCATDDSGLPAFRFYDPKADLSKETKDWQDVFQKGIADKGTSMTWLIITNGIDTYEGPWPSDQNQMLELLKKYGG